jgi:SAM-dependent methyltransferase
VTPRTLDEWASHWDAKAGLDDPLKLAGYCVEGAPVPAEIHRAAVLEPTLAVLELAPEHEVLEVGCGSGLFLNELERRVARVVGTDLSAAVIARYDGQAETYACAAHELPFEDGQFDRILMYSVAHYFPELDYFRAVTTRLIDLLRVPGILVVGDLPVGKPVSDTPFRWYEYRELLEVLEPLGLLFSIAAQNRLKRTINRRHDVIVYKD